jgi:hypothetical protein
MRRSIRADSAADTGPHLGAVAPVHPAAHTRVAFLGMDLLRSTIENWHGAHNWLECRHWDVLRQRDPADMARATLTRLTSEQMVGNPVWTPDGTRVLFRTLTGMY